MVRMMIFKGISKPQDRKTSSFCAPLARSHHIVLYLPQLSKELPIYPRNRNSTSLLKEHCDCTKNRTGGRSLGTELRLYAALRTLLIPCVLCLCSVQTLDSCAMRVRELALSTPEVLHLQNCSLTAKNLKKTRKAHQHQQL